jgi:hypothetical protein
MKFTKNLPIYVLSGALIFVGIASSSQAQAAWTSKETSRVKALEAKVQKLEKQLGSQELVTVRYLATGGAGGTYGDICPGINNLEGGRDLAYIGKLSPKTDIFGRPVTDIRGETVSPYVYTCKIQFYATKSN